MLLKFLQSIVLILCRNIEVGDPFAHWSFFQISKKSGERVKILNCKRVELVIMALGTSGSSTQPNDSKVSNPVGLVNGCIFSSLGTSFLCGLKKAIVAGSNFLAFARPGDEITGQVFNYELIVAHIFIKGIDDIVTICGDLHEIVTVIADRVGIAD